MSSEGCKSDLVRELNGLLEPGSVRGSGYVCLDPSCIDYGQVVPVAPDEVHRHRVSASDENVIKKAFIRTFESGATRDTDQGKLDYEGFLSPLVLKRYGEYLHKHRRQADGALRDSDNWQRGMPLSVYMKSGWRHFLDWWSFHRTGKPFDVEDALCAVIFNAMGYLYELLNSRKY